MLTKSFEQKNINIDDVLLFDINPRYSITHNAYDFEKIKNEKIQDTFEYEKSAIKKLIESEGNLDSLLYLMKSMLNGFNSGLDAFPFIIENLSTKKFIVIEGNRRFLCLKLLNDSINYLNIFRDVTSNVALTEADKKKFLKRKDEILDIVENYRKNVITEREKTIVANVVEWTNENYDDVIRIIKRNILSRHSHTENSSKKEWPRIKSLAEILNSFKEKMTENLDLEKYKNENSIKIIWDDTINYISNIYNREPKNINSDITNSIYVLKIFDVNLLQIENMDKNLFNEYSSPIELSSNKIFSILDNKLTLGKLIKKNNINLLDKSKIGSQIMLLRNDKDKFFKKLFDSLVTIENENYSWEKVSKFVYNSYKKKWLTTRGYNCKNKNGTLNEESIKEISSFFNENYFDYVDKLQGNNFGSNNENNKLDNIEKIILQIGKLYFKDDKNLINYKNNEIIEKIKVIGVPKIEDYFKKKKNYKSYKKNNVNNDNFKIIDIFYQIDDLLKKIHFIKIDTFPEENVLSILLNAWNNFFRFEVQSIKWNLSYSSEISYKYLYRRLHSSIRSIIETILLFETFFNWKHKYKDNKESFFRYSFFSLKYDHIENNDEISFYDLVIKFEEIYKCKKPKLNEWLEKQTYFYKNHSYYDFPEEIKPYFGSIIKYLNDYLKISNLFIHNFYVLWLNDETNVKEGHTSFFDETNWFISAINLIECVYKIVKNWNETYKDNPFVLSKKLKFDNQNEEVLTNQISKTSNFANDSDIYNLDYFW